MKRVTRKILRVIVTLLAVIIGPYVSLYVYINERGKDILLNKLKAKLNTKVELHTFSFSFPFRISLVDLKIKNVKMVNFLDVKNVRK